MGASSAKTRTLPSAICLDTSAGDAVDDPCEVVVGERSTAHPKRPWLNRCKPPGWSSSRRAGVAWPEPGAPHPVWWRRQSSTPTPRTRTRWRPLPIPASRSCHGELVVALGDPEVAEHGVRHPGDVPDRSVHSVHRRLRLERLPGFLPSYLGARTSLGDRASTAPAGPGGGFMARWRHEGQVGFSCVGQEAMPFGVPALARRELDEATGASCAPAWADEVHPLKGPARRWAPRIAASPGRGRRGGGRTGAGAHGADLSQVLDPRRGRWAERARRRA